MDVDARSWGFGALVRVAVIGVLGLVVAFGFMICTEGRDGETKSRVNSTPGEMVVMVKQ